MTNLQNEQLTYLCKESLSAQKFLTETALENMIQAKCNFMHGFKPTQEEINDTLFELGN